MSFEKNIKLLQIAEFEEIEASENEIYFEKQYDVDTVSICLNETSSKVKIWITNIDDEDNQYFEHHFDFKKLIDAVFYDDDYKDTAKILYDELFTNKLRSKKLEKLLK